MDKQKRLLEESDPGHFSMIRAMHLADLITLLNGMLHFLLLTLFLVLTANGRLLWYQLCSVFSPLLHGQPQRSWQPLGCSGIHAFRSILRLYGWQGRSLEKEELAHGPGARFAG